MSEWPAWRAIPSVEHVLPEFQGLEPRDVISAGRGLQLPVRSVESNGSLVIGSHPNAPPGEELPGIQQRAEAMSEERSAAAHAPAHESWRESVPSPPSMS